MKSVEIFYYKLFKKIKNISIMSGALIIPPNLLQILLQVGT